MAQSYPAQLIRMLTAKPGGGNKIGMKVVDERVTLITDTLQSYGAAKAMPWQGVESQREVAV